MSMRLNGILRIIMGKGENLSRISVLKTILAIGKKISLANVPPRST